MPPVVGFPGQETDSYNGGLFCKKLPKRKGVIVTVERLVRNAPVLSKEISCFPGDMLPAMVGVGIITAGVVSAPVSQQSHGAIFELQDWRQSITVAVWVPCELYQTSKTFLECDRIVCVAGEVVKERWGGFLVKASALRPFGTGAEKVCQFCNREFESPKDYYQMCEACYRRLDSIKIPAKEVEIEIARRYALFDFCCAYCGKARPQCWDHIIPKILLPKYVAGMSTEETFSFGLGYNLAPSCSHCNSSKGPRDLTWFYAYSGLGGAGHLLRLERIVKSHRLPFPHWIEFLRLLKNGEERWSAYRQLEIELVRPHKERLAQNLAPSRRKKLSTPLPESRKYLPGDRVLHGLFGEGVVISSQATALDEEVTVAFPGDRPKKLLASFADLQKKG